MFRCDFLVCNIKWRNNYITSKDLSIEDLTRLGIQKLDSGQSAVLYVWPESGASRLYWQQIRGYLKMMASIYGLSED